MAHRTKGSEEEDFWIWRARDKSRALTIAGSGQMAVSVLSSEVSITSRWERASAGAILDRGVTCHIMSKSCKNNDHLACHLDNLWGSLM